MMVKTFKNEHICQAVRNNRNTSSGWIAEVLATDFLTDPHMKLKNIRVKLKDRFSIVEGFFFSRY